MITEQDIATALKPYFITPAEYRCSHCQAFPPGTFTERADLITDQKVVLINWPFNILFKYFQTIREQIGKPLTITSGYRCKIHEQSMYGEAVLKEHTPFPAGKGFVSAHMFGLALDIAVKDWAEQDRVVQLLRELSGDRPRIGWKTYRQMNKKIVHMDCAFYITPAFQKMTPGEEW